MSATSLLSDNVDTNVAKKQLMRGGEGHDAKRARIVASSADSTSPLKKELLGRYYHPTVEAEVDGLGRRTLISSLDATEIVKFLFISSSSPPSAEGEEAQTREPLSSTPSSKLQRQAKKKTASEGLPSPTFSSPLFVHQFFGPEEQIIWPTAFLPLSVTVFVSLLSIDVFVQVNYGPPRTASESDGEKGDERFGGGGEAVVDHHIDDNNKRDGEVGNAEQHHDGEQDEEAEASKKLLDECMTHLLSSMHTARHTGGVGHPPVSFGSDFCKSKQEFVTRTTMMNAADGTGTNNTNPTFESIHIAATKDLQPQEEHRGPQNKQQQQQTTTTKTTESPPERVNTMMMDDDHDEEPNDIQITPYRLTTTITTTTQNQKNEEGTTTTKNNQNNKNDADEGGIIIRSSPLFFPIQLWHRMEWLMLWFIESATAIDCGDDDEDEGNDDGEGRWRIVVATRRAPSPNVVAAAAGESDDDDDANGQSNQQTRQQVLPAPPEKQRAVRQLVGFCSIYKFAGSSGGSPSQAEGAGVASSVVQEKREREKEENKRSVRPAALRITSGDCEKGNNRSSSGGCRLRLSQLLVIPTEWGKGVGLQLVSFVHRHFVLDDEEVGCLTVEDPTACMIALLDRCYLHSAMSDGHGIAVVDWWHGSVVQRRLSEFESQTTNDNKENRLLMNENSYYSEKYDHDNPPSSFTSPSFLASRLKITLARATRLVDLIALLGVITQKRYRLKEEEERIANTTTVADTILNTYFDRDTENKQRHADKDKAGQCDNNNRMGGMEVTGEGENVIEASDELVKPVRLRYKRRIKRKLQKGNRLPEDEERMKEMLEECWQQEFKTLLKIVHRFESERVKWECGACEGGRE